MRPIYVHTDAGSGPLREQRRLQLLGRDHALGHERSELVGIHVPLLRAADHLATLDDTDAEASPLERTRHKDAQRPTTDRHVH